jgi:ABC-type antimicrobial peptide transport system permease subunit
VASISLIVGGIGTMNVMLVSVSERTRQIGIRTILGARKVDILYEYIYESILLSLDGGLLCLVLGFAISKMVNGLPFSDPASLRQRLAWISYFYLWLYPPQLDYSSIYFQHLKPQKHIRLKLLDIKLFMLERSQILWRFHKTCM